MKKHLIVLVFHSLCIHIAWSQLPPQEEYRIQEIVKRWNTSHHLATTDQLQSLYAPSILFYGQYKSKASSIEEKSNMLKRLAPCHQEIITPVEITLYREGTIKCQFTKRIKYQNKIADCPSYLLLVKDNNKYLITGESDLTTDKKLGVVLHLGDELNEGNQFKGTWVIIASLILILGGLSFYYIRKRHEISKTMWLI